MNVFKKILSLFKPAKSLPVNEKPLYFTEVAISNIKSHLENRPATVKSAFKVSLVYQKEKVLCQVGFDDYKMIRKTLFEYPVPLIISEKDELFLQGAYIDYHKEEAAYFYYPNVHLEVLDRSNESIFVFYLDRNVIAPDSPISNYSLDQKSFTNNSPLLIRTIFQSNLVESIYLEKNFISIEKITNIDKISFEEKMSEIILSYFETCGYMLYVTETKIEEKQFAK
ncbi:MAG: NifU N-terminal domain-containing protein [Leptospiraceae bacterium]|nr:NifU N-terminal domain-containing protein [Leptospiraceae bacterium]